jgi:peptidoglycan/LPS O-acetylase OafA/YrhL
LLNVVPAVDTKCEQPGTWLLINYSLVQPAWTLALECYFYALVPLFFRSSNRIVALVALSSFALTVAIMVWHNANPWYRSFFPAQLYLFLIGFLAYRCRDLINARIAAICAIVSLVLLAAPYNVDLQVQVSALHLPIYALFALSLPVLFRWGERLPIERLIGDLSYPVYISHIVVLSIIQQLGWHKHLSLPTWVVANVACVLTVSLVLVALTWPIEIIRHRLSGRIRAYSSPKLEPI